MRRKQILSGLIGLIAVGLPPAALAQAHPALQVRAAFALERPLREIAAAYTRQTGMPVALSFDGSAAISKAVARGAGPDVVVCAERWLDPLSKDGRLKGAQEPLASTRLVLIAPVAATVPLRIRDGFSLGSAVGESRMAIGDPSSVPSGYYGKLAVSKLGGWLEVAPKVVRADVVSKVLDMVAGGQAIVGIVYDTDARADRRVKIIGYFPKDHYPRIAYAAAPTSTSPEAAGFLRYLVSPEAAATFKRQGFGSVSGGQASPTAG